jgi:hypothetical protein
VQNSCYIFTFKNDAKSSKLLYAQTLGLYGSWLAETRSENPNTIMEKYLDKVVSVWYKNDDYRPF